MNISVDTLLRLVFILLPVTSVLPGCSRASEKTTEQCVGGRVYQERDDDLAWENELVAFRAYGPATQARGEKAYGYDLFFKYPDSGQVLGLLYGAQTDPANWAKADSLRLIDPAAADDFISSFTYHIDHGLGMDCYPVGPTLGAGVCSLMSDSGDLLFPYCYTDVEIIDNGPDRFKAHLVFEPREINGMDSVVEHRIIELESQTHFNKTRVWYDNLTDTTRFIIGVPRRDDSPAVIEPAKGYIAYRHPTDGDPSHDAILAIIPDSPVSEYCEHAGHIAVLGSVATGDTITYRWGYTWPKSDLPDMKSWIEYIENQIKQ